MFLLVCLSMWTVLEKPLFYIGAAAGGEEVMEQIKVEGMEQTREGIEQIEGEGMEQELVIEGMELTDGESLCFNLGNQNNVYKL